MGVAAHPVVLVPGRAGRACRGRSLAVKSLRPDAHVFGVEPELAADTHDSLAAGVRTPWPAEKVGRTIADGLRGEAPAEIPFAHLQRYLDGVVLVSESQIQRAMGVAAGESKQVVEPSGAVALAGLMAHRDELPEGTVVAVLSGGNVDPERYVELLAGA